MTERFGDAADGKWHDILVALGVPASALRNKHGPCPMCQGKDRFRFDDKDGKGTWFCNGCGYGEGFELVKRFCHVDFIGALDLVRPLVGDARARKAPEPLSLEDKRERMNALWKRGQRVRELDAVWLYLRSRIGKCPDVLGDVRCVTFAADAVMVAKVRSPLGKAATIHQTFLTLGGKKANVEKTRKFMPGEIPDGAAVRLMPADGPVLGIAEGIETALSASIIFNVPVWAALNAGMLKKWQPPPGPAIAIFGDCDENYVGQEAAYALAKRLTNEDREVKTIAIPPISGDDWNDVLQRQPRF